MYTTTRPIILSFSGNSYLPGYYYYYRVLANGSTVYFGKTFCREVDGVPTIELDLRRILQANAYDGQYSLKPVYNNTKQVYSPLFPTQYKFANTDIMQRYTLRIESDTAETVVAQTDLVVTSAYDLIDEMPQPPSIYRFIQPLSYETSLIPSYPNVVTDKYGIFFFIEFSGNFTDTSQSTYWIYLLDSSTWSTYNYPLANQTNLIANTHIGYRNTLPLNVTMEYFFTNISPAFVGTTVSDEAIYGGSSTVVPDDVVYGGSSSTNYSNEIYGGDAYSAGHNENTRPFTGDIYITSNGGGVTPVKVAHIDECTKKYYLAWQTHSGAPFSYGFDGNTVKKSTVERTNITTYNGFDRSAMIEQRHEFELRSGIVDKELYNLMADIMDSPYLYLYSVEEDKGYYCTLQDDEFTWKKVKVEKQPLNLTLNLRECSSINK